MKRDHPFTGRTHGILTNTGVGGQCEGKWNEDSSRLLVLRTLSEQAQERGISWQKQLLRYRNCGRKTAKEIHEWLSPILPKRPYLTSGKKLIVMEPCTLTAKELAGLLAEMS